MKRRNFIRASALASTALLTPNFLRSEAFGSLASSRSGKILVVIQLAGGNDGLNTIVPHNNDIYYRERPTLSIAKSDALRLSDELGFHPSMAPLRPWFDAGKMTVVNQVGYPNPDRSHFRSMDIWQSGSSSQEYWSTGWLGRYLDGQCEGCPSHYALEVDDGLSLALKGEHKSGFAMSEPSRLRRVADNPFIQAVAKAPHAEEANVSYLYKTLTNTQSSAKYLLDKSKIHRSKTDYPRNKFANDLKQISELITADTDTRIYYVSLSGFDTHAGQKNRQARLLQQYATALAAFAKDLESNRLLDDVLVMTFSEFGRRVSQNASGGTDHGTANNVFLLGGKLKRAGFYNQGPDLLNLQNQDLVYDVDFRSIYGSILNNWLDGDVQQVLGKGIAPLPGLI